MAQELNAPKKKRKHGFRWWAISLVLIVAALGGGYYLFGSGGTGSQAGTTFAAVRGPLEITVLEGGNIEALESQEVKCEVQGQTKILSIIEEGYLITEEDVEKELVLVELDSKELVDRQTEQELQYKNAKASFTEAKEQYGIQVNQNESDIKAAELEVKFARMDFEKYLGEAVAQAIIDELELDAPPPQEEAAPAETESEETQAAESPETDAEEADTKEAGAGPVALELSYPQQRNIDFSKYADPKLLGDGEARQRLRELENELVLAKEEVGLAQTQLEGTERLFERDFVTKNDLDNDAMALKRKTIGKESNDTSQALFVKYEFPKQAEKLLSDYEEALRKLERAKKQAVSKLAQYEAKLNSAEAQFALQTRRRTELKEQIEKCVIRADRTGLVVYGAQNQPYWREEQIEEGASVRERQVIITIPDTSVMAVKVKVHESYVKQVKKEQKVNVRIDAFPDARLNGEVQKIAVLPESQSRWMNPDLKVYETLIVMDESPEWLKPGMSAEAEIIVEQLEDVLQVPVQAISLDNGERVCYLAKATGSQSKIVETGRFNDSFIEVKSGLDEGDVVLLRAPLTAGENDKGSEKGGEKPEKGKAGGQKGGKRGA